MYQANDPAVIKNPISLARLVLQESTRPLTLQRVPPNLLVGNGATDFAYDKHMPVLPREYLVSPGARDRWLRWKQDLERAEEDARALARTSHQPPQPSKVPNEHISPPPTSPTISNAGLSPQTHAHLNEIGTSLRPLSESAADQLISDRGESYGTSDYSPPPAYSAPMSRDPMIDGSDTIYGSPVAAFATTSSSRRESPSKRPRLNPGHSKHDGNPFSGPSRTGDSAFDSADEDDHITDTVGAIAVDCFGNIAAGSSSGGIGMKHRGRVGPAALVGIGTSVIPADPDDASRTSVATVTSGTGEHMATTMAAATCSERIFSRVRRKRGGGLEYATEEEAMRTMIEQEFMGHPGVKNSHCTGAIGVMSVKKTADGIFLYFAHNTDSFAIASMHSEEKKPVSVMSRNTGSGAIAQGGRVAKHRRR